MFGKWKTSNEILILIVLLKMHKNAYLMQIWRLKVSLINKYVFKPNKMHVKLIAILYVCNHDLSYWRVLLRRMFWISIFNEYVFFFTCAHKTRGATRSQSHPNNLAWIWPSPNVYFTVRTWLDHFKWTPIIKYTNKRVKSLCQKLKFSTRYFTIRLPRCMKFKN